MDKVKGRGRRNSKSKGETPMISGMYSAISALSAFGKRMGVIADNVANVESDGFKKSRALMQEQEPGGVRVTISRVETPGPRVAEETTEGLEERELSNVNLEQEIPNALLTEKMFTANTKVVKTEEEMIGSVLDIIG
jgi:flagellar basal-body rod protein FlgC